MTTPQPELTSGTTRTQPERLSCPRCGNALACHVSDPLLCQCADVDLPTELTSRIYAEWRDCLCLNCLRELCAAAQAGDAGAGC